MIRLLYENPRIVENSTCKYFVNCETACAREGKLWYNTFCVRHKSARAQIHTCPPETCPVAEFTASRSEAGWTEPKERSLPTVP